MHISLIDEAHPEKGLLLGMMGGSICEGSDTPALNGKPRKAFFRLECGESEDKQFVLDEIGGTQGTTKCEIHFKYVTPVACPWYLEKTTAAKKPYGALHYLTIFAIIFAIYLAAGIFYNKRKHNLRGVEAIPHIDKWRRLPGTAKSQLSGFAAYSANFARSSLQEVKRRIEGYRKV